MLYVVSLMPLVERGRYLRCVLSYVFLSELISALPDIGSFLEIKVGKSADEICLFISSVIFVYVNHILTALCR